MTHLDRRRVIAAGAGALASATIARPALAQRARAVNFMLDVPPYAKHALFYYGLEKGFFAEAGFDATFSSGKGSADVAQKVAGGAAQFGFIDAGTLILARGKGLPLKLTSMTHYKNLMAVIGFDGPTWQTPKDMEGKKIGAAAGDAVRFAIPALAKAQHFDDATIQFVTIDAASKLPLLLGGKVDAVCDYAVSLPLYQAGAAKIGKSAKLFQFADFGIDIYSNGIACADATTAADAGLVKGFNDAIVRSTIAAVENRDEAVDIFVRRFPAANREITRAGLDITIDHLLVPEVQEHGIGPMLETSMTKTRDLIRDFYGLTGSVETRDVYSNDFVTRGQKPAKA